MKTMILSSSELNQFIIFETARTSDELIQHLKGLDFKEGQEQFKELIFSSDLKSEIFSTTTTDKNKEFKRYEAVLHKEQEAFKYIGANRGTQATDSLSNKITGVGALSNLFLSICQIAIWLVILASIFISIKVNVITGISMAVGALVGFGLIFILGDILKNIAEINQKTNRE